MKRNLRQICLATLFILLIAGCRAGRDVPLPTPEIAGEAAPPTPTLRPTSAAAAPAATPEPAAAGVTFAGAAAAERFPQQGGLIFYFDTPMNPESAAAPVRLDPSASLDFAWEDDGRTLTANPREPLPAGEPHTVTLDPALRTATGAALRALPSWTIVPAASARVVRLVPGGVSADETRPGFTLVFDRAMDPDSVAAALQVDPPADFTVQRGSRDVEVTIVAREPLRPGTLYQIAVGTGAVGVGGGAPLGRPYSWQYRLPEVVQRILLPTAETRERALRISFNYPMDTAALAGVLQIEPETAGEFEIAPDGTWLSFTPAAPWATAVDYTLRFRGDLRLAGGQTASPPSPITFGGFPPVLDAQPRGNQASPLGVIRLTFDRPMDEAATAAALDVKPELPGRAYWEENTLVYEPEERFFGEYIDYTVTLERAVAADGTALLNSAYSWSFRTDYFEQKAGFGYGANAQLVDASGRRAIQYAYFRNEVEQPVDFELYRLTLPQYIDKYSSGFRGVNGYQKKLISTAGAELVTTWTDLTEPGVTEYLNAQEVIIPAEIPNGLYILNARVEGRLYDQLLVDLSDRVVALKQAEGEIVTWVTDINGGPLAGVPVEIYARDGRLLDAGLSDGAGLYRADLGSQNVEPLMVVAGEGENRTISGLTFEFRSAGGGAWWEVNQGGALYAAYLYTERPIYRPGQTINFKGIVRADDDAVLSNLPEGTAVTVRLRDARDNVVQSQELATNPFGTVHSAFDVADGAMSGTYSLQLVVDGYEKRVTFEVQDYRKPEYEIEVDLDREAYVDGDQIDVAVDAAYYFGEPVAGADVSLRLYNLEPTYDWRTGRPDEFWYPVNSIPDERGETDAAGRTALAVRVDYTGGGGGNFYGGYDYDYATGTITSFPYSQKAVEITVEDGSGQSLSTVRRFRVYRAAEGISLQQARYVQEPGQAGRVTVRIENLTGRPVAGREVELTLNRWDPARFGYDHVIQRQPLVTGGDGAAAHELVVDEAGYYELRAEARDENGRRLEVRSWLYVTGRAGSAWFGSGGGEQITIRPDRNDYAPGDVARLTVESPVSGPALLVVERGSVRREQLVELTAPLSFVELPIEATDAPNIFVTINAWQPLSTELTPETYGSLPDSRLLTGQVELAVPVTGKTLDLAITPDKNTYAPGEEATFTVRVTNAKGEPVSAEVSLALVDEAIFALADDTAGPILEGFYFRRTNQVDTYNGLAPVRYLGGMGGGGGGGGAAEGGPRVDFPDTALWVPVLQTDASGEARVTLTLPDSLTTWRLTAKAATADTQVGEGTNEILVRKDIVVRPFLPRTLTAGDRLTLSAMVQNFGDEPQTLDVSVSSSPAGEEAGPTPLAVSGSAAQTITLQPDESRIVGWEMVSTEESAGSAEITILVEADGALLDGVVLPLEIRPLAVADIQTLTGQFTGQTAATITADPGALPQSVVEIELSRSIAGTLLEGLDYLTGYPYGCVEQTMSRALPNAVVARAFAQLGVSDATIAADLPNKINASVQRLYGYQHTDGGWGWWYDDASEPYNTAWVLFGLVTTREAGYEIDERVLENGAAWLVDQLGQIDPRTRAYVLYSLALADVEPDVYDRDGRSYDQIVLDAAEGLAAGAAGLDPFSQGALALALWELDRPEAAREIVTRLEELALETAGGGIYWRGATEDGHYNRKTMASDVRTTALMLSVLSRIEPDSELIPGAVRYLMGQRRQQGWGTTNETAFAIIGLTDHLLATSFGEEGASTEYEVLLNGERIAGGSLGRGAPAVTLEIPYDQLAAGDNQIVLRQDSDRPLYFVLNRRQLVAQAEIAAAGGIAVTRTYTDLDGEPLDPARITLNQLVRVELTVELDEPLAYAIVEDKLPGGLEALNERLNTTSHVAGVYDQDLERRYESLGYNYKEIRDERVSFFITELSEGRHTFTYVARATHAGDFVAMPAEAYGMYDLARWGRSASDALVIQGE